MPALAPAAVDFGSSLGYGPATKMTTYFEYRGPA